MSISKQQPPWRAVVAVLKQREGYAVASAVSSGISTGIAAAKSVRK